MKYMFSTSDESLGPFALTAETDADAVEQGRMLMQLCEARRAQESVGFSARRLTGYRVCRAGGGVLYVGWIAALESGVTYEAEAKEGILKQVEALDWVEMPDFQDRPHFYTLVDIMGVVRGSIWELHT